MPGGEEIFEIEMEDVPPNPLPPKENDLVLEPKEVTQILKSNKGREYPDYPYSSLTAKKYANQPQFNIDSSNLSSFMKIQRLLKISN